MMSCSACVVRACTRIVHSLFARNGSFFVRFLLLICAFNSRCLESRGTWCSLGLCNQFYHRQNKTHKIVKFSISSASLHPCMPDIFSDKVFLFVITASCSSLLGSALLSSTSCSSSAAACIGDTQGDRGGS